MKEYICYLTPQAAIAVCEKSYWDSHGHLDDRHNRELSELMANLKFTELRTNIYWHPPHYSTEMALNLLSQNGFKVIERPEAAPERDASEPVKD